MEVKVFGKLKQWIKQRYEKGKNYELSKKKARNFNNACKDFQIMEFNGILFISHNGVPVVRVSDMNKMPVEVLAQSRVDYLAWKNAFSEKSDY